MEKRAFERKLVNVRIDFSRLGVVFTGTLTNLSKNGMFIETRFCLPLESSCKLFIHSDEEILKIPFNVSRVVRIDNVYDGIGIELLNPPKNYLEFVDGLKTSL